MGMLWVFGTPGVVWLMETAGGDWMLGEPAIVCEVSGLGVTSISRSNVSEVWLGGSCVVEVNLIDEFV